MSYTKHTWVTGEDITDSKLNNMEDGIKGLETDLDTTNGSVGAIDGRVKTLETTTGTFASVRGELVHIPNSVDAPVRDIIIYGCTTQRGTPAPGSPISMYSVGSVRAGSKNLSTFTIPSISGLTIVENSDGSITVNGTVSSGANPSWISSDYIWIPAGTYTVSGCPEGGSNSGYRITMRENTYGEDKQLGTLPGTSGITDPTVTYAGVVNDDGAGCTFTITTPHCVKAAIRLAPEYAIPSGGLTFRVMLQAGSIIGDYVKCEETDHDLLAAFGSGGIRGVRVSEDGNYTDSSGQQWICDTIDLSRGVFTKRVGVVTFDADTPNAKIGYGTSSQKVIVYPEGADVYPIRMKSVPLCNKAVYTDGGASASQTDTGKFGLYDHGDGTSSAFYICPTSTVTDTASARDYVRSTSHAFIYALTTPVETPLTDAQLAAVRAIATCKGDTWMFTDCGGGLYTEGYVSQKDTVAELEKLMNDSFTLKKNGGLVTAENSVEHPIRDIVVYGSSFQRSAPTPTSPVTIRTLGSGGVFYAVTSGENLFRPRPGLPVGAWIDSAASPLKYIINPDYTVTVNSESATSATATPSLSAPIPVKPGEWYYLSGCPAGGSNTTYDFHMYYNNSAAVTGSYDYGNGAKFQIPQDVTATTMYIIVSIRSGQAPSNLVFRPALYRIDSATNSVPYKAPVFDVYPVTVPDTGLPGIAVSEGGNYVDASGQQWICDTIDLGKGVYTKRVDVLTSITATEQITAYANTYVYSISGDAGSKIIPAGANDITLAMCNVLPSISRKMAGSPGNAIGVFDYHSSTYNTIRLAFPLEDAYSTTTNVNSYLSTNSAVIIYPLITPVETALTDAQIAQLKAISTYNDVTNICAVSGSDSNGMAGDIDVRYNVNVGAILNNL